MPAAPRPFLTARWANLALITYAFSPSLLDPLLPPGTTADVKDGHAFASLVAFDFLDTRVLGVRWPGFVHFPEVNLRYYVRDESGRRGVAFVSEFVPHRTVAFLARAIYNEPYRAIPMTSSTTETPTTITVEHRLRFNNRDNLIAVRARRPAQLCPTDSADHFFKEHTWGFGRSRAGRLLTYHVAHPTWDCYPVEATLLDFDFPAAYGPTWAFLQNAQPHHTLLAVGSAVSVYPKGKAVFHKG